MTDPRIRPLHLAIPESDVQDLRDRLRGARLPEAETVARPDGELDWSQGPPRSYLIELSRYWADEYDWRRLEAELNAHGQAVSEIDGLDIHFLHVRSARPDAVPLVLTHGWPSSVVEPLEVMDALTAPASPDQPAFHVVAPSLPGFGFSGRPTGTGWTIRRTAHAWAELMTRLGYDRFFAAGGDWGGRVTATLAIDFPDRVRAIHTFTPYLSEIPDDTSGLTETEQEWVAATREFWESGGGYSLQQSTRPQAVAYGLVDSPTAQLAWILDKFAAWTDWRDHLEDAVSRDRILDTVSLYWFSATGGSSARIYWENHPPDNADPVTVPTGVTTFPADIEKLPRAWVEQRFRNIRSWRVAERGGHFPMLEVPGSYVAEVQHALRDLVTGTDL